MSTWDAANAPIDNSPKVAFPNIFAFAALNASLTLSSQVVSKSRITLTLKFNAPYTGQPITSITVSGLSFAASLQQLPPAADCYVNSPTNSVSASSVAFEAVASEFRMAFITGQPAGLPSGTAGSLLAVTCRITNCVNAPAAIGARSTVPIVAFGANSAPLYIQSAIKFPAIFEQSLGLNRPRVS